MIGNGWTTSPLGKILTRSEATIPIESAEQYKEVTIRLWGKGIVLRRIAAGSEIAADRRLVVRTNQFIVSRIDARNGAMGLVPDELDGAVVSNDFPAYEINSSLVLPAFLGWLVKTNSFIDACRTASEGTTNRVRLQESKFFGLEIPLPPLPEQRRTVAKIERLAGKIAEARVSRSRNDAESDVVLASARNAIVEQLREQNGDVRLGDVCTKMTDGPHVSPRYTEAGIAFISVRNITEQGLDFSTAKFVNPEDHAKYSEKANVEHGDVLYTKGGTTGVARRVDTDRPFSIWVHVALLKLKKERAIAAFVEHMLNSPTSRQQAEEFTRGSSNRDLGLTRMCNILFPLAPLKEQHRIVAYLDGLQTKVDELKRLQTESAAKLDALLPAILDRAFKGEL